MSNASKLSGSDAATVPLTDVAGAVTGHEADVAKTVAELTAVRAVAEPLAALHGLDIVEVVWAAGPQGRILRVTIERAFAEWQPSGPLVAGDAMARSGIKLDDCVRVSRDLSAVLDADEVVAGAYSLEVSSPGLNRPLASAQDYQRHVGLLAKVKLRTPAEDGQKVLRGVIESCDDLLVIEVDGKRHRVALGNIAHARLVFMPKKGKKRQKNVGHGSKRGQR